MRIKTWIDRIEEDIAVLECEGRTINFPIEFLPPNICEGNCVILTAEVSEEGRKEREQEIDNLMKDLFER